MAKKKPYRDADNTGGAKHDSGSPPTKPDASLVAANDLHVTSPIGWRTTGWVALAATALCLFFFFPDFTAWPGLHLPDVQGSAAVNRAAGTLLQVKAPWAPITNPSNRVLSWRLFFPLLAHYTGMSERMFLALPFIGVICTVVLIVSLARRRIEQPWRLFMVSVLMISQPWFFVSTGWLAYFDAWIVLGLLVVAFVPPVWPTVVCCLIMPWIDERFLLGLPVAVTVRWWLITQSAANVSLESAEGENTRNLNVEPVWHRWAIIAVSVLPYVMVRGTAMFSQDATSSAYVSDHLKEVQGVSLVRFIEGWWYSYRAMWIGWWIAVVMIYRRGANRQPLAFWLMVITTFATSIGGLMIAGDMTRSLMMLMPAMLAAALWFAEQSELKPRWLICALVGANLLLPAKHVIWSFKLPVFYVYHELNHWQEVQPVYTAERRLQVARGLLAQQRREEAWQQLELARTWEPNSPQVMVFRVLLLAQSGQLPLAVQELESVERSLQKTLRS